MRSTLRGVAAVAAATSLLAGLTACGAGGSGSDSKTVKVLMVNNPQMVDLQKLTKDNFTKDTGIKVEYKVLPENDLRDTIAQDVANGAGQYDVVSISNYEVPFYSKNKWLAPLDSYIDKDSKFDQGDILKPMADSLKGSDGKTYAEPFYGESSMVMYRKDVFKKLGIEMPERPTWDQIASYAAKADGAEPGMAGVCLRGLPGWGQVFAPLTTVVNTFGGTWFNEDWSAGLTAPEFKAATNFYVDLVRKHGEKGASQAGFTECLNAFSQGKAAMWYDATSAGGLVEDKNESKVAGKVGYAYAPVKETKSSGWLYTWAWGVEQTSKAKGNAWKFASWASSKDYENLVGKQLGWSRLPDGKRTSTYSIPEYKKQTSAYADIVQGSINSANPTNPGVQKRPFAGIQFVGISEFTKLGTDVSQGISDAIAGRKSVDAALEAGQEQAQAVGDEQK